jgi:hypothetical protein
MMNDFDRQEQEAREQYIRDVCAALMSWAYNWQLSFTVKSNVRKFDAACPAPLEVNDEIPT